MEQYSKETTCKYCGKTFMKSNKRHVYCSGRCKEAYRLSQKPKFHGICPVCGKEFEYIIANNKPRRRYCSLACAAKDTVPNKKCTCVDCGAVFEFHGRTNKLRCPKCWSKHRSLQTMLYRARKDPSVQIGIGSGGGQNSSDELTNTPERDAQRARRRLYYQQNKERFRASASFKYRRILSGEDACIFCGYSLYQGALVVHHIDMDRTHNEDDNLAILCSNCHAHLHAVIRKEQKETNALAQDIFAAEKMKADLREAETKGRNEAGKPDRATRTEGCEESQSGATHSSTSSPDMSCHEAVPKEE